MSEEQKKKEDFVKKMLDPFIKEIDGNVTSVIYRLVDTVSYELEYVLVTWKGGYVRRIYITGDSLSALSREVLRIF